MRNDPIRVADTIAWLQRTVQDLRAAEVDLAAEPSLLSDAAFHCQQATEKAIEGFLTWHDVSFRRTHDLAALSQQCFSLDPSLKALLERAEQLTAYAWIFRYPTGAEEPSVNEVSEALVVARDVFNGIIGRLPSDVWPPTGR